LEDYNKGIFDFCQKNELSLSQPFIISNKSCKLILLVTVILLLYILIVNQNHNTMNEKRMEKVYTSFTNYDPPPLTPAEERLLMQTTTEEDAWAVVGDLVYLTPETLAILEKQAKEEWPKLYPKGEPMFKRDGYIFVLHSIDLAESLDISLRTAQRILQVTRIKLKKDRTDHVTVKEFCVVNKYDEEDLRRKLRNLYEKG
jgi:hypothetical protein